MINPQKGIDLMNNKSIIIRILFAVTIFQHSQLMEKKMNPQTVRKGKNGLKYQLKCKDS
jgi:regulatory protein YycI of two-component signal transduction system YycFG